MFEIIWYHVRACARDLRARKVGDLTYTRTTNRDVVANKHREWRLR